MIEPKPDFDALQKEVDWWWDRKEELLVRHREAKCLEHAAQQAFEGADRSWSTANDNLIAKRRVAGHQWNIVRQRWEAPNETE